MILFTNIYIYIYIIPSSTPHTQKLAWDLVPLPGILYPCLGSYTLAWAFIPLLGLLHPCSGSETYPLPMIFLWIFQVQVPLHLPCYDFIAISRGILTSSSSANSDSNHASYPPTFRYVTGSKSSLCDAVHRDVLIPDYHWLHLHEGNLQPSIRTTDHIMGLAPGYPIARPLNDPL